MESAGDALAGLFVALCSSIMCFAYLIPMTLVVLSMVVWILALVDVLQRGIEDFPSARAGHADANERLVWVLVVLLVGVVGAAVYYFMVMKPYPRPRVSAPASPQAAAAPAIPETDEEV